MTIKNNCLHFFLLVFLSLLGIYGYNHFIQSDEFIIQGFSDKYTREAIEYILNVRNTVSWVNYVANPILTYITTTLIALVILLVIWIYYLDETIPHVKFSDAWRIVLHAQWSSVIAIFVKLYWFGYIYTDYTMDELSSFYPLSIINFFDINKLDKLYVYPIQLINVFELIYWIVLTIGIKDLLKCAWMKSLKIVFLSYGVILIVWIIVVMFISLYLNS
jgi:hypothetical protein